MSLPNLRRTQCTVALRGTPCRSASRTLDAMSRRSAQHTRSLVDMGSRSFFASSFVSRRRRRAAQGGEHAGLGVCCDVHFFSSVCMFVSVYMFFLFKCIRMRGNKSYLTCIDLIATNSNDFYSIICNVKSSCASCAKKKSKFNINSHDQHHGVSFELQLRP